MTTDEAPPRIGTRKFTHHPKSGVAGVGMVTCQMYGYVDEHSDQPSWHWRWNCTDPQHVHYILDRYPTLEQDGEVVIY
ncbi:MAG: hypothetical protein GWN93_05950 [Deltaproteobacteria bacterium]|nr:hypothetical protein [Deltaproteobacteria bacterium]